jgi:hypothetical protein
VADAAAGGATSDARESVHQLLHLTLCALRARGWLGEPTALLVADIEAAMEYASAADESSTPTSPNALRSRTWLTHEQQQIVSSDLSVDQVMLVMAFAGTGKTTTLVEYTKRRPTLRFAYLAFNVSVMEDARYVACGTARRVPSPIGTS